MPEAPKKQAEGSGWWPSVETEEEAKGAAHQGAGAAIFVASVTALFAVLAISRLLMRDCSHLWLGESTGCLERGPW